MGDSSITVRGGALRGIDVDMNAISDTAQTVAAIAPFASGATRIRNVAHIRHKETDRIHAVATELRALGITVDEQEDGLTIHPGPIRPAVVETYDDHRMAMSFSLIGLKVPGIRIANPDCTAKTYPRFFDDLQALARQHMSRMRPRPHRPRRAKRVGGPPTARRLAFTVLSQYKNEGRFVSQLLDRELERKPDFPSGERRLAVELINGVVRRRLTLDTLLLPHVCASPTSH